MLVGRPARAAALVLAAVAFTPLLLGGGIEAGRTATTPGFYYCADGLLGTGTADALANGSNCAFWLAGSFPLGGGNQPQLNGTRLPGLDVLPVWKRTQGAGVTVAVLDTGADPQIADYQANLLPGRNLYGGGTETADTAGHGSLIASLIAAQAGNGGYVGVAPQAKLLPLKIMGGPQADELSGRAAVAAIYEAIREQARVANCSFSRFGAPIRGMRRALQAAAKADLLVVIAAGNNGASLDLPANVFAPDAAGLSSTLTVANVAATSGLLAPSSNWGVRHVQVAAYGDFLYGDLPGSASGGYLGGTSAAAATVSGIAALLRSAYPAATAAQVARAMIAGSTPLAALDGKVASGGIVSAAGALAYLDRHH